MVAISRQYAREMHDRFGYLATWLPNSPLKLGDVGVIRNQVFEPVASLQQLGIGFTAGEDGRPVDLDYTSSDAVTIEAKALGAGAAPGFPGAEGTGSVSISFRRADAVVFQATGCVTARIADVVALGEAILARYHDGSWDAGHVVVTDLVSARTATVLISNSQNAQIDLALKAQAGAATAQLADAAANVSVTRASGIGTRIVAAKGLTPLFKVAGVRRRWLREPDFTRRKEQVQFIELDYKDFV